MARAKNKMSQRLASLDKDKPSSASRGANENPFANSNTADDGPVMDNTAFIMVSTIAFIVLCAAAVVFGIQRIENDLEARATRALRFNNFADVEVVAVGQDLTLTGTVVEEKQVAFTMELVGTLNGVRSADGIVKPVPPREPVDVQGPRSDPLVIAWTGPDVIIRGTLSDQATVDAVLALAAENWSNVDAVGLVVLEGLETERDWLPTVLELATETAERIDLGEVVANPSAGVVKVSAEFETRQEQREARGKAEDIVAALPWAYSSGLTVKDQPIPKLEIVEQLQTEIDELVLGQVVEFETNSDLITPIGTALLDVVLIKMLEVPTVGIEIAGHTDDRGSDEYNMELSQRRGQAVLGYLVAGGADPARFVVVAFGETQPIADNGTAEGRAQNRRIVFTALED